MGADHVLILAALDFEARPIARKLGLRFTSRTAAGGSVAAPMEVRLLTIGPGARHLPASPEAGCKAIVMAGIGGGLVADLRRGDLVVDAESEVVIDGGARRGRFATVRTIVSSPAEKLELQRKTGAIVTDMENDIARAWARRHQVPFLGIRVVGDTSAQTLDPATLRITDEEGFLRVTRLLSEVIRRPRLIRSLWQLRTMGKVVEMLAGEVRRIVEELARRERSI